MSIESLLEDVALDLQTVKEQFVSKFNSSHEGYAVLLKAMDILWITINDQPDRARAAAVRVASVGILFLESVCDENQPLVAAAEELARAEAKFAGFNSAYEGYAVILEEVDELWDVVKLNPKKIVPDVDLDVVDVNNPDEIKAWQDQTRKKMLRDEAVQVAAMGMRFVKCDTDSLR